MSGWNFADVWEEIARVQPDKLAIACGETERTWSEFSSRADRLGSGLADRGVVAEARVAQYLHNGPEYLESLFACFKFSFVPVNTNYRYVADELRYLWSDADVEAVIFHGTFAGTIASLRPNLPSIRLWVWVDDSSGPCPEWAVPYETLVSDSAAPTPDSFRHRSGDDLYLLYTGGTTGTPKGVMWRQDDLFVVLNRTALVRYPEDAGAESIEATLRERGEHFGRVLPAAPLMHGTAAFSAFGMLSAGGAVILCEGTKFDPVELLDTLARHHCTDVAIVGDAFARPLLDALDAEPGRRDLSALVVMLSSGVMWSAPVKDGLIGHLPNLLCVDTLGSSEAVGLARSISSSRGTASTAGFKLGSDARVIREDGNSIEPGSGEVGLVAIAGRGPIGYLGDPEKSARTFREIDGMRWTTPGDHATVDTDGTVRLLGRGSGCINTGGEKVFPEEVEEVLKLHSDVIDSVVVGVPNVRFGESVAGFVQLVEGSAVDVESLIEFCRSRLAAYKVPRRLELVADIGRAANGKVDQARWKMQAGQSFAK
ncbi:CaiC Acyl-CoA synthetases (AMP-forming)/AMP-acid ligases II [Acidimicrobiia bacterium]